MLVVHLFLWCLMHHCILFYVLFQSDIVRLQEQWLSAIDMRVHANGSLIAETDIGQTAFDTQCPGTKWPCQCRPTALSFKSIHILYTKTKLSLWTPDFAVDSLSVNDIQYAYIYICQCIYYLLYTVGPLCLDTVTFAPPAIFSFTKVWQLSHGAFLASKVFRPNDAWKIWEI